MSALYILRKVKDNISGMRQEKCDIPFVPCQAYLDIYFYKHSQQRLCKEIIF